MSLDEELRAIENAGLEACRYVQKGDFDSAKKAIRPYRHSVFVSESERIITIVEARILQKQGDLFGARKKLKEKLHYIWGTPEAFEILSEGNRIIDGKSKYFYIELCGGRATHKFLAAYLNTHIASFDVIANSADEAIQYIDSIADFTDRENLELRTCEYERFRDVIKRHPQLRSLRCRGIVRTYPFQSAADPTTH